jgi:hypothetical protein
MVNIILKSFHLIFTQAIISTENLVRGRCRMLQDEYATFEHGIARRTILPGKNAEGYARELKIHVWKAVSEMNLQEMETRR